MSTSSAVRSNWTGMLDRIQQSLARTLAEVEERECSQPTATSPSTQFVLPSPDTGGVRRVRQAIESAERDAASVQIELRSGEDALRTWLELAAQVRQTLATHATPRV